MPKFSDVLFDVYSNHPDNGLKLIGHGLSAKQAVALAKRVFVASRWTVDTQIIPVPGVLDRSANLQKRHQGTSAKKPKRSYSGSVA